MIAHPAADDEHTFVTQRRKAAANREVRRSVAIAVERELHERHVSVRVHHFEWNEDAVIETARGVFSRLKSCGEQELADPRGKRRRSRDRIREPVRVLGKP